MLSSVCLWQWGQNTEAFIIYLLVERQRSPSAHFVRRSGGTPCSALSSESLAIGVANRFVHIDQYKYLSAVGVLIQFIGYLPVGAISHLGLCPRARIVVNSALQEMPGYIEVLVGDILRCDSNGSGDVYSRARANRDRFVLGAACGE